MSKYNRLFEKLLKDVSRASAKAKLTESGDYSPEDCSAIIDAGAETLTQIVIQMSREILDRMENEAEDDIEGMEDGEFADMGLEEMVGTMSGGHHEDPTMDGQSGLDTDQEEIDSDHAYGDKVELNEEPEDEEDDPELEALKDKLDGLNLDDSEFADGEEDEFGMDDDTIEADDEIEDAEDELGDAEEDELEDDEGLEGEDLEAAGDDLEDAGENLEDDSEFKDDEEDMEKDHVRESRSNVRRFSPRSRK